MVAKFKRVLADYLSCQIDNALLIETSKELYKEIIDSPQNNFVLDYIISIPFIHEIAYCKCTNAEMAEKVRYFLSVLNRESIYHYAAFFQLSRPNHLDLSVYDLNYPTFRLTEIESFFTQYIDNPRTIADVLSNTIFNLLSSTNYAHIHDSDFNYINCAEITTIEPIKNRVQTLLSYLLGYKSFYMDILYSSNGEVIFTII